MKVEPLRMFSVLQILCLGIVLISINSCTHPGTPADQLPAVCFTGQVLPIFQNNCAISGCHSGSGGGHKGSLADYASIMRMITPGNAANSQAYKAMISTFQLMPPKNALPMAQRELIRLWIDQGAKETTCGN